MPKEPGDFPPPPIRLALLISSYNVGGFESRLERVVRGLDRKKFRPVVLVLRPWFRARRLSPELRDAHERFFDFPRAEVRRLDMASPWDLPAVLRAARFLRDARVGALVFFAVGPGTFLAPLAGLASGLGRGRLVRIGGTVPEGLYPRFLRAADRLLLKSVAKTVVPSEFLKRELMAALGLPAARIAVIPNGVDPAGAALRARTRRGLGLGAKTRAVGLIANFTPNKNHALLLRAAAGVLRSRPDTVFLLVGEGRMRAVLESQARALGIAGRVRFLGFRADAPAVAASLDVGVLCSRMETYGNVLLESMAAGVPVVATDVGGVPEIVRHGENGLLVPPDDDKALARALLDLLGNPGLARRLGGNARRWVAESRSVRVMVRALEEEIAGLLGRAGGPGGDGGAAPC